MSDTQREGSTPDASGLLELLAWLVIVPFGILALSRFQSRRTKPRGPDGAKPSQDAASGAGKSATSALVADWKPE